MHSFNMATALVATALVSLTMAQYTIDPTTVSLTTRKQWCQAQIQTCPFICAQNSTGSSTTDTNTCDPASLTYECICGNGLSPNASEYSLTLPYFICTQYGQDCVQGCDGDNTCQSACRDDHPCGAQNPQRINTTSSATQSATGAGAANTMGCNKCI